MTVHNDICESVLELLVDYSDGELGDDQAQRDERKVADHSVHEATDHVDVNRANVLTFEIDHTLIGTKSLGQLSVPDIDSDHLGGSALQGTIGEPTRRCTCIQESQAGDVDAKFTECVIKFLGTAPDKTSGWPVDHDRIPR